MIRKTMLRQGEFLFRHRSFIPLLLLPVWFCALQNSGWIELRFGDMVEDIYDWLCLGVSAAGVMLRGAIVGFVPKRTSGRNTKKGQVADTLNTTGFYSIVRHPLYVANGIVLTGFLLASGSLWFFIIGILAFCVFYERIMFAEEEFLRSHFGSRYLDWAEKTPAFIPRPRLWVSSELHFSWRTALKREYLTIVGIVFAFTLMQWIEDISSTGTFDLEYDIMAPSIIALFFFLVVRRLRKQRMLSVKGR